MIVLIILIYFALVYAAFRFIKIPVRPLSVSIAILLGIAIISVIVASWQAGAPVSKQTTLTRYIVSINPDVKGLIKSINVGNGDRVKKGEVLFQIDPAPFQAAVDQYTAQLQSAHANFNLKKAGIALSEATLKRAEADASYAKSERDAANALATRGSQAISKLKIEKLNRAADAAEAAVNEAIASTDQARFALAAAEETVKSVKALLATAKFNLGRTSYIAPSDGIVINMQAREGTMTSRVRAAALGTFMDLSDSRIIAVFPQNLMRKVRVGDAVEIAFMSRPGIIDTGKVFRIAKFTGEGQIAATGELLKISDIGSNGLIAAVIRLEDEDLARELSLGEVSVVAIYTQPAGPFHIVSKIYLRMLSIMFFLP